MNEATHTSLLANLKSRFSAWMLFSVVLVISNLALAGLAISLNRPERIIITPPDMRQAFWVEGEKVDPEYLMEMAKFFAQDLLTYNPENAAGQFENVLKYVDPQVNTVMRRQLMTDVDQIKSKAMSSVFWVQQAKAKGNTVYLYGTKRDMMAGNVIGDSNKGYQMDFSFHNRLVVTGFKPLDMPPGGIAEWERNQAMAKQAQGEDAPK